METSIQINKRAGLTVNTKLLTSLVWWHWLITAGSIATHYFAWHEAIHVARIMCGVMLARRVFQDRKPTRAVQVYAGFFLLLYIGELPYMGWYYYTMLIGTLLNCAVGYCPLDRLLQTLPFNTDQPFLRTMRDALTGNLLVGGLIQRAIAGDPDAQAQPACLRPS